MRLAIDRETKGNGVAICLQIGKRLQSSYFSNPSKSIDHADILYIKDRFPIINTRKRIEIFKRLYKNLFINVSEEQFRKMKHAVGLDYKKKPYRNRFFCSALDKTWNDLVEKGLAEKGIHKPNNDEDCYFWLTQQGVEFVLGKSIGDRFYKDL